MNAADKKVVSNVLAGADVLATAIARLYKGTSGSWELSSVGAAVVARDPASQVHYLHIVDLHTEEIPLVEEVYSGFEYATPLPFFHYFEGGSDVFGFSFADEGEAASFAECVGSLPGVSVEGGSGGARPSTPTRSAPPPVPAHHAPPVPAQRAPPPAPKPAPAPEPTRAPPAVERNSSVGDKMRNMSSCSIPAETPKKKEKKSGGFFSRLFKKEEEDDEEANFTISAPTNFTHASHIGIGSNGSFDTQNIPPEWKKLFQAAGIRKKDLNNPETCAALMEVMNDAPPAPPAPPAPSAAPPAPPAPNAPPAPPPPPAPPAPGAPAPPRPPAAPGGGAPPPRPANDRSNLLADIEKGRKLKSVEERTVEVQQAPSVDSDEGQNMIQKLSKVMVMRRAAIAEDEDEDDDNDEWSD